MADDLSMAPKFVSPVEAKTSSPPKSKTASPKSKTASPTGPGSPQAAFGSAQIEVDDETDGGVSITDDQLSSYTASLTSSVLEYPTEHGRRYHAFRAGVYYGPNDEKELDRLDLLSALIVKATGKLYYAPIEEGKTNLILDIGTGTGIWAIEMGELFPNAEVIGNDLSPIQPSWVPPNVKFEVDDVESPWVGRHYDYIFCRTMAVAIKDWPQLMSNIYHNTTPGGWVEFQDWDVTYHSDDGSLTDEHACRKMIKTFFKACEVIGRDPCPGPKLSQWIEDAGFTNVVHHKFMLPLGRWPKDPHLKDIGMMNLIQILEGLEAFNLRLLTGVLGWTEPEVQVLLAQCRNELKSGTFHAYMNFYVAYAQKPETKANE